MHRILGPTEVLQRFAVAATISSNDFYAHLDSVISRAQHAGAAFLSFIESSWTSFLYP